MCSISSGLLIFLRKKKKMPRFSEKQVFSTSEREDLIKELGFLRFRDHQAFPFLLWQPGAVGVSRGIARCPQGGAGDKRRFYTNGEK